MWAITTTIRRDTGRHLWHGDRANRKPSSVSICLPSSIAYPMPTLQSDLTVLGGGQGRDLIAKSFRVLFCG